MPASFRPLRLLTLLGVFLFLAPCCHSQFRPPHVALTDDDTVGYRFLQRKEPGLENAAQLAGVFQKLHLQRTEGGQKISIVHLGDSHILGNFLTREVRKRLQSAFGDAGRGLIFPYRLAGSNGPQDYLVETNCRWQGANCQRDLSETTPFGVSGFSLETGLARGEISVRLRDTATSETRQFTKVTVFHRRADPPFALLIRDEASQQHAQALTIGEQVSTYYFDRPVGQFTLTHQRTDKPPQAFALDGFSLENELSGVLYHSIGVNGGKFTDFLRARDFAEQIGELQPDLIILSFGTNEAQGRPNSVLLYRQIDALVRRLLAYAPQSAVLLTTPADSYLRGRGLNPYMDDVSRIIRSYAFDKGYALWDLFERSGGEHSARLWKSNGLMSADSVHFSKAGYAVQGKLLYESLIRGYNEFVKEKP
jgi:lysophospholipase L1-like esterase